MRRLRALLLIAIPALFATVMASACARSDAAPPRGIPPVSVQLSVVQPGPVEDASVYVASIASLSSTIVKPEVSGEVVQVHVKSGDRVATGAPLFQIDPRVQRAAVSSQDAARAAQEASVAYAQQQLERAKTLLAAGAISQQEFDQAKASAETAGRQLASLDARVQQERATLQYYEVRAPMAGIVGDIPIRVGMRVTTDTMLTSLDRNEALEVYVQLPLDRSADLRTGLPMQVLNGATGAVVGETTVSFVSPRVDEQTQSVLVKAELTGRSGLRALQYVRARIVWKKTTGLLVPVLAVQRISGLSFVFVAEGADGHLVARQRTVTVGPIVGNAYRIESGLAPGDRLVVSGMQKLANGAPIRPE